MAAPAPTASSQQQPGCLVGFANLPNQVHRKIAKRGFEFTLMVVGPSGLGKSTLINSLFLSDLYPDRRISSASEMASRPAPTTQMEASTVEIEERGVRVRLTLVDTPGFDEGLDSSQCYAPLVAYIDRQFDKYLSDESGLNRRNINDNRVHCLFYFVSPFGAGLKHIDLECLRALHQKANIIVLIGRADVLTSEELAKLKDTVRNQLKANHIKTYGDFVLANGGTSAADVAKVTSSTDKANVDEIEMEFREQSRALFECMPFAVCGSSQVYELKDKRIRGRMYQWGLVDIDNVEHCDFVKLRNTLTMHMQDLQDVTHELHYENYRSMRLSQQSDTNRNKYETKQQELLEMEKKLERMKAEMDAVKNRQ